MERPLNDCLILAGLEKGLGLGKVFPTCFLICIIRVMWFLLLKGVCEAWMSSSASHPSYTLGPCAHLSHSPPLPYSNAPGSPCHPEEKPESLQEPQDPNEVCTGPPLLWLLQHAGTPPPQGPCTSCPFSWERSLPRYPWGPTPLSPVSAHMSLSFRSFLISLHKSAPCYFPKSSIFLHRCLPSQT